MKLRSLRLLLVLMLVPAAAFGSQQQGLPEWLGAIESGLSQVAKSAERGDLAGARATATQIYLDHYEVIEGWYGPGGHHAAPPLSAAIASTESAFHVLLRSSSAREVMITVSALRHDIRALERLAAEAKVPLYPDLQQSAAVSSKARMGRLQTSEIKSIAVLLEKAEAAFARGDHAGSVKLVEELYLEGFEPLESRLPSDIVSSIERVIHLQLRPALKSSDGTASARAGFVELNVRLSEADAFLARGGSFWFGAFNSLVIIVREGLEAVLLIGALLAYLTAIRASARDRRRIWLGAGAGIGASLLTWVAASTIIPLGGASRELVEGITALVAVAVLLYVSHWLFQKTYIHDWKQYLRDHLGSAISRGSGLAMMGLSFAAVYREGFETVLFYQALLFDAGGKAVLAGFLPGVMIISIVGWAIIRAGVKLPIKRVFAVTNSILLYLAFVFFGKGIYNLQESGAFSAHPISWLPSHPALQQVFGFYPLIETVGAQLALATVLALVFMFYQRMLRMRKAGASNVKPLAA
ncbi:MAG: FTR1 family protein [Gemmatimonadota bacterium]